jgi:hypothetical protein
MKRVGMKDLPTGVGKAAYPNPANPTGPPLIGDWVTPYFLGKELNAVPTQ